MLQHQQLFNKFIIIEVLSQKPIGVFHFILWYFIVLRIALQLQIFWYKISICCISKFIWGEFWITFTVFQFVCKILNIFTTFHSNKYWLKHWFWDNNASYPAFTFLRLIRSVIVALPFKFAVVAGRTSREMSEIA